MTDPDILETIANAIGTGINSRAANETDREFAKRFLFAYRAMRRSGNYPRRPKPSTCLVSRPLESRDGGEGGNLIN